MMGLLIILCVLELVVYYVKPTVPPLLVQLLHIATIVVFVIVLLALLGIALPF